jgi:hypothetical protein
VFMLEPDSFGFDIDMNGTGNVTDYDNVFLQFLTIYQHEGDTQPMNMGEQATYRAEAIANMRALAKKFIYKAVESDGLDFQVGQTGVRAAGVLLADYLDTNACGIEINLPMRNVYPDVECYDMPVAPPVPENAIQINDIPLMINDAYVLTA